MKPDFEVDLAPTKNHAVGRILKEDSSTLLRYLCNVHRLREFLQAKRDVYRSELYFCDYFTSNFAFQMSFSALKMSLFFDYLCYILVP